MSLRILETATHVREQAGNHDAIGNEVDSLAEKTGETAQYRIEEYGHVSCVYKATGDLAVQMKMRR